MIDHTKQSEIPTRPKADLRSPVITRLRRGIVVGWLRVIVLLALDILLIGSAWNLAIALGTPVKSPWVGDPSLFLVVLAVQVGVLAARGLYKAGWLRRDYLGLIKAISLANILLLFVAFLYQPNQYISRSSLLLAWLLSILFVCLGRFVFDATTELIRSKGAIRYPIFLVADRKDWDSDIRALDKENRYDIVGFGEPNCLDRDMREAFFSSLRSQNIAEVFVSWSAIKDRLHLAWHFQTAGITLRIITEREFFFPKSSFLIIGGNPCLTVNVPAIAGSDFWVKRGFDFCLAVLLITAFSPLYLLIAVLIRMDSPGPIFFRQTRVGLQNQPFKVWKFRTMVANAAQLQAKLEAQNEMKDGVLFKMKSDPRVTRVGAFLRRYSLDELPQIFNVLLGEMSFVGPRPLPERDVAKFKERYFIRQEVLPGITGLWQVSGRSDIDNFEDAVNLDFSYIANWSVWLDLKIILQTVKVVFLRKGAY